MGTRKEKHCEILEGPKSAARGLTVCLLPQFANGQISLHSSKILTIQQGLIRGVSSVGNPPGPLMGFNSGSVAEESSND